MTPGYIIIWLHGCNFIFTIHVHNNSKIEFISLLNLSNVTDSDFWGCGLFLWLVTGGVATEEVPHLTTRCIGAHGTPQGQLNTVWLPPLKVFIDHISQCLCEGEEVE